MTLYKGKYLIGIYAPEEEGETLLGLCDNTSEFAKWMDITRQDASLILHKLFTGVTQGLLVNHKICTVAFIKEE